MQPQLSQQNLNTLKYQGKTNAVKLFVTSLGNHFMWEIAQIFEEGFRDSGVSVELAVDQIPSSSPEASLLQIVVAPHEFYPLFLEKKLSRSQIINITKSVYLLNVEQPGSDWFEIAYRVSKLSKGVLDINQQGVNEFKKRGIPTLHSPLGYAQILTAELDERESKSVDIVFIGANSKRRELFLSKNANWLNRYNCRLILTRFEQPNLKKTPGFYSDRKRNQLLQSGKILINIHFANRTYFEWHRALIAIGNHCLLISEPSDYTDPLVSDRHIIFAEAETIGEVCQYYLENECERRKITEQAYQFVMEKYTSGIVCLSLLCKLDAL